LLPDTELLLDSGSKTEPDPYLFMTSSYSRLSFVC
jgi:hypothetical protein